GLICVAVLARCDYGTSKTRVPVTGISSNKFETVLANKTQSGEEAARQGPRDPAMRRVLLDSVIQLVESAPLSPDGRNFENATDRLNEYFEGYVDSQAYTMPPEVRAYLVPRLSERGVQDLETRRFRSRDG